LYISKYGYQISIDCLNWNGMGKMVSRLAAVCMVSVLFFCGFATRALALPLAPGFTAVSLDRTPVASTQLAGKAYIVNFFASWCPPCRSEIPDMVALQSKYGRKGFTFIGVAVNETEPSVRSFITKNRINYPVVMVDEQLINSFSKYVAGGIRAIPTSFVINSSGRVTQVITGPRSKEVLEKIITDALKKPGISK
jgi:thiol-disulfide isomerase/thioredoxin